MAGWHRITLVDAGKLPRKLLFEHLLDKCSVPFSPICVTTQCQQDIVFYVEKPGEAKAIKDCNKMTMQFNAEMSSMSEYDTFKEYKFNIKVVPARPPATTMNPKGIISVLLTQFMGGREIILQMSPSLNNL